MTKIKARKTALWLGGTTDGLGWLLSRMSLEADVTALEGSLPELSIAPELLHAHCRNGLDRIVVACEDRISYPQQLLVWLQRHYPEIPQAVATGTWWEGAGRTGIRQRSHLVIPWYRWWDSWTDWIEGNNTRMLSPCVTTTTHIGVAAQPAEQCSQHGQVIAGRQDMAETWAIFARASGCTVESRLHNNLCQEDLYQGKSSELQAEEKSEVGPNKTAKQDWILWDDSCLDTIENRSASDQLIPLIRKARLENPNAVILCALSVPRWSTWKQALEAGADELVVKPTAGFDFSRIVSRAS